ncbi:MAG: type-F conjugative transfer system secretin TraK [Alphaproteobacteria bacterium]|nr:type-F conjugative transfer system secretin TraK [Alphaproteobacteria bacterium]
MILKPFLSFLISISSTTAHAAIIKNLDELRVIQVPISQEGLTRIKVQEDRILHVFGNAGEYVLETDDNQGQIFIRPRLSEEEASIKPISLTLTTEGGHTQDLRLIPKHQAPEAIILKSDNALKHELEKDPFNGDPFNGKKLSSAPIFHEEVEGLMQALQEERIPLGYKETPINLTTLNEPYQRVREIQGEKLRGLTYHTQNKTQKAQALSESEVAKALPFKGHRIVAILIPKKTLNPKEGTNIHVVLRAN